MNKPTKEHWVKATNIIQKMTRISLRINTETNNWTYVMTLVDDTGSACQTISESAQPFRITDGEKVQEALMDFRAGLAYGLANA